MNIAWPGPADGHFHHCFEIPNTKHCNFLQLHVSRLIMNEIRLVNAMNPKSLNFWRDKLWIDNEFQLEHLYSIHIHFKQKRQYRLANKANKLQKYWFQLMAFKWYEVLWKNSFTPSPEFLYTWCYLPCSICFMRLNLFMLQFQLIENFVHEQPFSLKGPVHCSMNQLKLTVVSEGNQVWKEMLVVTR